MSPVLRARYPHFALARDILGELADGLIPADQLITQHFRGSPQMGARDRRLVAEAVYGVLRARRSLAWRMQVGEGQWDMLVAGLMLEQGWAERDAVLQWLGGGGAAALAHLDRSESEAPPAVRANLPDALAARLLPLYGEAGLLALMEAMNRPAPVDLRVNPLKTGRAALLRTLQGLGLAAEPTPYAPLGVRLRERRPLTGLPAFREGLFELQDEASQLIGHLLEPQPGEEVLDLCAGAGGKTLQLGALMRNQGRLLACDIAAPRLERMAPRLRRAGLSCVQGLPIRGMQDARLASWRGRFDRILIDAPCSGSGTWRRNPELRWRPPDLDALQRTQAELLAGSAGLLRPGGRMVYATCSLLWEENEGIIDAFLARNPGFTLRPAADILAAQGIDVPGVGEMLRLDPARHGTDGFFAAVLERQSPSA